jgi:hypothetical protein
LPDLASAAQHTAPTEGVLSLTSAPNQVSRLESILAQIGDSENWCPCNSFGFFCVLVKAFESDRERGTDQSPAQGTFGLSNFRPNS